MKFEKLREDAILPVRATRYSAGYDFFASEDCTIYAGEVFLVPTHTTLNFGNKTDHYLDIRIRSSMALKHNLILANGCGVVDADYYPNHIGIMLRNIGEEHYPVKKGDKIAQGLILNYSTFADGEEVTTVRDGGFGSTGKK